MMRWVLLTMWIPFAGNGPSNLPAESGAANACPAEAVARAPGRSAPAVSPATLQDAGDCGDAPACTTDADCDDRNVCTIDECVDGCCEWRPQCSSSDDCPNGTCDYGCCVRCPSCHDIRGILGRCFVGDLWLLVVLRNDVCDGNTITLSVNGSAVTCDVRGRSAFCRVAAEPGDNTVCPIDPDCPKSCRTFRCRR